MQSSIEVTERVAELVHEIECMKNAIMRYDASKCSAEELAQAQEYIKAKSNLERRLGCLVCSQLRGF